MISSARRGAARRGAILQKFVTTRTDVSFARERVSFGHHRLLVATIYTFCVNPAPAVEIADFNSTPDRIQRLEQCSDFDLWRPFPSF